MYGLARGRLQREEPFFAYTTEHCRAVQMTLTPAITRLATRSWVVNGTAIVLASIATLANQSKSRRGPPLRCARQSIRGRDFALVNVDGIWHKNWRTDWRSRGIAFHSCECGRRKMNNFGGRIDCVSIVSDKLLAFFLAEDSYSRITLDSSPCALSVATWVISART